MTIVNTKPLLAGLLVFALLSAQAPVYAEENNSGVAWVLVGDSPMLDRSSKNLFNGNGKRGIRYAHKAMLYSQSDFHKVIARHNLCIAYTFEEEQELAAPFCELTRSAVMPRVFLKEIKPGLYKITRNSAAAELMTLTTLIARNLEHKGLNGELQRMAQAN